MTPMHEEMHANAETEEEQQRPDTDKVHPVFGDEVEAAHGEEDQQDHVCARHARTGAQAGEAMPKTALGVARARLQPTGTAARA